MRTGPVVTAARNNLYADAFNEAVSEVTAAAEKLIRSLRINAPPRNREEELKKARLRGLARGQRVVGGG